MIVATLQFGIMSWRDTKFGTVQLSIILLIKGWPDSSVVSSNQSPTTTPYSFPIFPFIHWGGYPNHFCFRTWLSSSSISRLYVTVLVDALDWQTYPTLLYSWLFCTVHSKRRSTLEMSPPSWNASRQILFDCIQFEFKATIAALVAANETKGMKHTLEISYEIEVPSIENGWTH